MKRIIAGLATVTASVLFAAPADAFTHRFSGDCPNDIVGVLQEHLNAVNNERHLQPAVGQSLSDLRGRVFPVSNLIPSSPPSLWSASTNPMSVTLPNGMVVTTSTTYVGNQTRITQENYTMDRCTLLMSE